MRECFRRAMADVLRASLLSEMSGISSKVQRLIEISLVILVEKVVSPVLLFLILSSTVVLAYFALDALSLFSCVRATSDRGIKPRHEGYTKPKSISIQEHHLQCRFPGLNILNSISRNV